MIWTWYSPFGLQVESMDSAYFAKLPTLPHLFLTMTTMFKLGWYRSFCGRKLYGKLANTKSTKFSESELRISMQYNNLQELVEGQGEFIS
jgi:hypothetical protein